MPARVVSAASGARWLVEGWNIFRAAPLAWMALVFVYLFAITLSWQIPYAGAALAVLFTPAISVSFMAVARAAHRRAAVGLELVAEGFRRGLRPQLVLGLVYGACVGAIYAAANLLLGEAPATDAQDPEASLGGLVWLLVMYAPVMMMFWFAPVLAAWHGAGPGKALFFSLAGFLINWRAFAVYGAASVAAVLGLTSVVVLGVRLVSPELAPATLALPMFVAVFPTLCGSYYASYRDVFGYIAASSNDEKAS
jgi:hypothetical protein